MGTRTVFLDRHGVKRPLDVAPLVPHNLEAERAVLGGILLDNEALGVAIGVLNGSEFFLKQHRLVFQRMRRMAEKGEPIDLVTLVDSLSSAGELDVAGSYAYLAELIDGRARVTNVDYYARIVKKKALLRNLAYAGEGITQAAFDPEADPNEILERFEMLSAQYRKGVWAERKLRFRTGAEIAIEAPAEVPWIASPWVAAGCITEVDGKVKVAGKTTWATYLVRAVLDGALFMGRPTTKTPVVYLTEQPPASFQQAMRRAGLLRREDFIVLYWKDTIGRSWAEVARDAVAECKRRGATLLVVDTLPQFAGLAGDAENNAGDALVAMQPLQQAAAEGIGCLAVRHDRKAGGEVGDSGRGSSAYAGAVDTVLSIRRPEGNTRPTLRVIKGVSRFDEVPGELVVELTSEGYATLGSAADVAAKEAEGVILAAAPASEDEALTLEKLVAGTTVKRATGQRAIENLMATGRFAQTGAGKRGDPFRYYRP